MNPLLDLESPLSKLSRMSLRRRASRALAITAALTIALSVFTPAPFARAEYAQGGEGKYPGAIDWFTWGDAGQDVSAPFKRVISREIGGSELNTECEITDLTGAQLQTYIPGDWQGDGLDDLYNIGGTGKNNTMVSGLAVANEGTASFTINCGSTLDGIDIQLQGLVIADAEASNNISGGQYEYIQATPVGDATWRIIERHRSTSCNTDVYAHRSSNNTLRLHPNGSECTSGPLAIAFMEGANKARVELKGGGQSAVAIGVVLQADFGDAPEGYPEAGALFEPVWSGGEVDASTGNASQTNLGVNVFENFELATLGQATPRLGDLIDADTHYVPSEHASHDDSTGEDDEDAITDLGPIHVTPGQEFSLEVACAGEGYVAGWLDWNRNGAFSPGEKADIEQCNGGPAVDLTWTVPADTVDFDTDDSVGAGGYTFLRLRIAETEDEIMTPAGMSLSGEVEDHAVQISLPSLEIEKSAQLIEPTRSDDRPTYGAGDTIEYTITATNSGESPFTDAFPAIVVDDVRGLLEHATYNDDATAHVGGTTSAGEFTYTDDRLRWTGELAPDDSATITYSVTVTGAGGSQLTNIAWEPHVNHRDDPEPPTPTCTTEGTDPETGNSCATVTLPLTSWSVEKIAETTDGDPLPDGTSVRQGHTIVFKVLLTKQGPGSLEGVTIDDDLSEVLTVAKFNAGSGSITFRDASEETIGSEPVGPPTDDLLTAGPFSMRANAASAELRYEVTVTGGDVPSQAGTSFTNTVTATSDTFPPTTCAPGAEPVCSTAHALADGFFTVSKVSTDGAAPLAGQEFEIRDDDNGQAAPSPSQELCRDASGEPDWGEGSPGLGCARFYVSDSSNGDTWLARALPPGTYWLVETTAPEHHQLLAQPVKFTVNECSPSGEACGTLTVAESPGIIAVDDSGYHVTLYNPTTLPLPPSGAFNVRDLTTAGIALLTLAGLGLAWRQRKTA